MRLFFKHILLFVLPAILISPVADNIISSGLKNSDYFAQGESYIWNKIFKGEIDDDIYIYGSSRAWVHFDSQIIEDETRLTAFNFGLDGHYFFLQHLRHKLLLKNNPKPKIIVLSLDGFTLSHYDDIFSISDLKDFYNSKQFLPFIFDEDIRSYTSEFNGFNFFDYHFPLIRYYGRTKTLQEAFRNKDNTYYKDAFRTKGFRAVPRTWTNEFKKAVSLMNQYRIKVYPPYEKLMNTFLSECASLGIKVIMVYSPVFIDGQSFVSNRKEVISLYREMAEMHNLYFLDYSNHPICKQKQFFYNSQHLNGEGAKVFTNIFVNDLIRLNFIKQNNL